ncbi:MAG: hypothetical protein HYY20_13835 [Candidatus Tectomicrobia bacterium]|uniref:Uncharacterized protein n=1 Tax=Tectimicrobiota bacterium TaxID=2528274 RepID=A0A932CRB3_UNCTE|nr:hypothetical protein [Candidatus Tectomicrobia bacterium]
MVNSDIDLFALTESKAIDSLFDLFAETIDKAAEAHRDKELEAEELLKEKLSPEGMKVFLHYDEVRRDHEHARIRFAFILGVAFARDPLKTLIAIEREKFGEEEEEAKE